MSSFLATRAKRKERWLRAKCQDRSFYLIEQIRPSIEKTRKNRTNKSEVYKKVKNVLSDLCIQGDYIGLAAGYAYEIGQDLGLSFKSRIVNVEKNRSYADQLEPFTDILNWLNNGRFFLARGDVINILNDSMEKFSIIDLDLMKCLATPNTTGEQNIQPIVSCLKNSTTNKFLLMLWSCYGMKALTEKRYDTEVRDTLLREIRKEYKILKYIPFKYCDNHIPIKVEILGLEKKKKRK
jgi:hypothetical protein